MIKWVFLLLQLVLCGQVWGDIEYPLTNELHDGGVGQVVTMISNEYKLTEGYVDRNNKDAQIQTLVMGKLRVVVMPAHARIRIMNIVPKYTPLMELPLGKSYDIEVDAPGYETVKRTITLKYKITPVFINMKATSVATGTVASLKSTSTSKVVNAIKSNNTVLNTNQLVVRGERNVLYPKLSSADAIHHRGNSIKRPKNLKENAWGDASVALVSAKVYASIGNGGYPPESLIGIDRLLKGQTFVSLSVNGYWRYIVYLDANKQSRHGWVFMGLPDYRKARGLGRMHPKYMRSVLDGYFDAVDPVYFRSSGFSDAIQHSMDERKYGISYGYGDKVPVVINDPGLSSVLVRSETSHVPYPLYHWVKRDRFLSGEKLVQVSKHGSGEWLDVVRRTEFGMGLAKKFISTPVLFISYLGIVIFLLFTPSFWDMAYSAGKKMGFFMVCGIAGFIVLYLAALLMLEFYDATQGSENWVIYIGGLLVTMVVGLAIVLPALIMLCVGALINYTWPILLLLAAPGLLIFAYDLFYYFLVAGGTYTQRHDAEAGLHASKHQKVFNVDVANSIYASVQRPFKAVNTWADGIHYEVQSRRAKKMSKMLDDEAEMLKKYENIEKLRERKRHFEHVE